MKKHILCFGDSNTHGYCADPSDCADGGDRFNEQERWTCLLQDLLGDDCKVYEEGLSGRTTVFSDPLHESMDGLGVIYSTLMSHERVDLLIIMLGTNDTKERLGVNAPCIALGLERLIQKAKSVPAWKNDAPNIQVVCPPHIGEGMYEIPAAAPWAQAARKNPGSWRNTTGKWQNGTAAAFWMPRALPNSIVWTICT